MTWNGIGTIALAIVLGGCGSEGAGASGDMQTVQVSVAPASVSTIPGGSVPFAATVTGTANTAVVWTVSEGVGGTVDASGRYVAPGSPGVFHVSAASVADPSKVGVGTVTVAPPSSTDIASLSPDRKTVWNPGPTADAVLGQPLDPSTRLPVRTTICKTVAAGSTASQIQTALNACPQGQVVQLAAGSWTVDITGTSGWGLKIPSGVVLRGAGRGANGTRLTIVGNSSTAYGFSVQGNGSGSGVKVSTDGGATYAGVAHGATQIPVANASTFNVGDMIMIDGTDAGSGGVVFNPLPDSYGFFNAGRSIGQITEVVAKSGNVLTVYDPVTGAGAPVHFAYTAAMQPLVYRFGGPAAYTGIEDLYVQASGSPAGNGNGFFYFNNARNSWIKNVELARASWKGLAVDLVGCFRCVLRDSYIHDAWQYVHGGDGYHVRLRNHTSESLVENNVVRHANKLLLLAATGGGNVIGYNFIDWGIDGTGWQETTIDFGHASFPHFDLAEGNLSANASTENVWGNQGWMTVFRNYLPGTQSGVSGLEGNASGICFFAHSRYMSVVGNVVGTAGVGFRYDWYYGPTSVPSGTTAVWRIGQSPNSYQGSDDKSRYEDPTAPDSTYAQLFRHGNYDNVAGAISWDPSQPDHALPASLYLTTKPAFFGGNAWPWVEPTGATAADRVKVLPAYDRWAAGAP